MATAVTRLRRIGPELVELEVLARDSGVHPEVVGRLVRLGLLDTGEPDAAARLAKAVRLRRDLGLSYGAAVLVCELLARIDELEARWTPRS
jgi:hypothetical protein